MNDDNASERAVELMQQALDLLRLAENAPASPVNTFLTAKRRRALRRDAARLRQGKAEPRYKNLHSAEELADLYERTVQRDEMFERSVRDFKRIARDLGRIREEHPSGLQTAMEALVLEAKRSAEGQGPGSEAARRYRNVLRLAWLGYQRHSHRRRQRAPVPRRIDLAPDPSVEARYEQTAAELLTSPPSSDDAVIAIPPEGKDSGRGRIFLRIGIGQASWVGSFERGHTHVSTIFMLPDGKRLFVSAEGAGYVIDAKSRTLLETTGTQVVGAMRDEPMTLCVVDHNGMSLEAFGRTGRLWKTDTISSGGFRRMAITDDELVGEARHPTRTGWARFFVKLATGDVEIDATDGRTE
jgi:uncharacterized protein YfkK (UPF0435 family)